MSHSPAPTRYAHPEFFRRCGRSGLKLPAISLGLWHNFGAANDPSNCRALILRAFDLGITHFDLANNYGPPPGSAEESFGRILQADLAAHRDELIISTKAGYYMWPGPYGEWGSRKYVLSSLDASLTRMGVDYVDVFYHHRPDPDTPLEETMGALATAVTSGKALYAGISNYNAEQTREAHRVLGSMGIPLIIHQPRYNMFDRRMEDGLLDALAELDLGSIVFSPLAQGLLTGRYLDGIPADSRAAEGRWISGDNIDEVYLGRASALSAIAEARGQSLAQLALLWVLRHPQVTSALIGASSVRQLDNSLDALAAAPLSAEEIAAIEPHAVHGTGSKQ